ncbi:MAG: T9SS type A sorting domain-containing protein [Bacteroidetes bacterium]|nr:T9SS type A sorting domain-containing protein [Bacteroidota bacterium]
MKKIYLSILGLCFGLALSAQTAPTCSLDPVFIASNKIGVWPDSATNFISGVVGQPYVQNVTVKVPKDTTTSGFTFCFNRFELSSPSGITNYNLPPGLNFTVTPALTTTAGVIYFPGNANNCASIWGTPTVAGSYSLQLQVTPFINGPVFSACPTTPNAMGGSSSVTGPTTLKYYIINITAPQGVETYGKEKIALYQNAPNPFRGKTDIKFYVESEDNATISVYNALGSLVYEKTVRSVVGENTLSLDAENWNAGMYMYSIKFKGLVSTKRMMVGGN